MNYSKNIELFGIVGNLTPLWEETEPNFPFADRARQKFLPFKNHDAVKNAQKLLEKRSRRYLALFAFYLSDLPEAKITVPSLSFFAKLMMKRSIPDIRDFYYKSDFESFWLENAAYYGKLQSDIMEKIKNIEIASFLEGYFGCKMDRYVLVFTPQMARFQMGQLIKSKEGKSVFAVFGPREEDMSGQYFIRTRDLLIDVVFHEFGRLFMSDILERQEKLLKRYSHLHKKFKKNITNKELRSWHRFFFENMYRAVQSRLVLGLFDETISLSDMKRNSGGDFLLVPALYELIAKYERSRETYKDLESFLPDLLTSLEERLKDQ
ncbi:MAG: DUF4932 domain-containing protein [Candidatus Aminicenantes bacterium]|nr:DUF4932 domain-containing protein [Candidatus Aminicenantes bacterium]